ncbi:hypothetical protein [Micromonospora narathiwatensis]|uniref:Uncharacterized protein n=1 Tax=Micromonospora narathiwatensis TaxID=299146 RepID=A0A1A8Z599_9ACTN|nr:hypothetical protein [Micromonospora narathiwatensis]SBT39023.1 hypothetical protein GA0070621_0560 [Micromonospora narathiwatensis]
MTFIWSLWRSHRRASARSVSVAGPSRAPVSVATLIAARRARAILPNCVPGLKPLRSTGAGDSNRRTRRHAGRRPTGDRLAGRGAARRPARHWPAYVAQISQAAADLPPDERARAIVLTANYGEAGALDRYGPTDLPDVYSGHNELWFRGQPPETATVVVAVGYADGLDDLFGSCVKAVDVDNGVDIPNEEQDNDVRVCRDPIESWATLWPKLRPYS